MHLAVKIIDVYNIARRELFFHRFSLKKSFFYQDKRKKV